MTKILLGNLKGPKGDKGDKGDSIKGEPGPAGPNTVPTNEAIADAIRAEGPARDELEATVGQVASTAFASRTTSYENPRFVRANGGDPVFSLAGTPAAPEFNSIYWPTIVDAAQVFGITDPARRFRLYFSSNHEPIHAKSGIGMLDGPTMAGPWTYRGRVYRDDTGGRQTETPTIFPDPTGEYKAIMLYQQEQVPGSVGGQSTLWAGSNDGIAWTRGGVAIDIPADFPGDGHTGYANVVQIGQKLFAHSGAGGYLRPTFGLSESYDGRSFTLQRDPLYYHMDLCDGRRIEWNSISIVPWRGKPWAIGQIMNMQAVFEDPRDARIAVFPVSEDLRRPIAKPQVQLYPPQGGETTNYGATRTFVGPDNALYLYYQVGNSFYLATVN